MCSYLRLIDSSGAVSVKLVFAKSRVSPIKPVTVPRLELTAADLAAKCSIMLEREFKFDWDVHGRARIHIKFASQVLNLRSKSCRCHSVAYLSSSVVSCRRKRQSC